MAERANIWELKGKAAEKIRSLCLELPLNMWVPDRSGVGTLSPPLPAGMQNFPLRLLNCSQPSKKRRKDKGAGFCYQYWPLKWHLASSCVDLIPLLTSISIVHSNAAFVVVVVAEFSLLRSKIPKDGRGRPLFRQRSFHFNLKYSNFISAHGLLAFFNPCSKSMVLRSRNCGIKSSKCES